MLDFQRLAPKERDGNLMQWNYHKLDLAYASKYPTKIFSRTSNIYYKQHLGIVS